MQRVAKGSYQLQVPPLLALVARNLIYDANLTTLAAQSHFRVTARKCAIGLDSHLKLLARNGIFWEHYAHTLELLPVWVLIK